jgi:recombinational DNA repair protein RecR
VTPLMDFGFKAAYEACMGHGTFMSNLATFHAFGLRLLDKTEHVCKACKQLTKARGGRYCDQCRQDNRTKNLVLFDMALALPTD